MNRPSPRRRANTLWQIFALPTLIALISVIGLIAALLGDGILDAVSWAGLGIPVAIVVWAMGRRTGKTGAPE